MVSHQGIPLLRLVLNRDPHFHVHAVLQVNVAPYPRRPLSPGTWGNALIVMAIVALIESVVEQRGVLDLAVLLEGQLLQSDASVSVEGVLLGCVLLHEEQLLLARGD